MMPVEEIYRRRINFKTPPPGMTPWRLTAGGHPEINHNNNSDDKFVAQMKRRLKMKDLLCGFRPWKFIQRKKIKKVLADLQETAETVGRGVAAMTTPYVNPLIEIVRQLVEQAKKDKSLIVHLDVIGGEDIVVNEVCVQSSFDEPQTTIKAGNSITPSNYEETIEYYQNINSARQNYYSAAKILGELLEQGRVEGDAKAWVAYMEWATKEEREWREKCLHSHERRESDKRFPYYEEEISGLCNHIQKVLQVLKQFLMSAIDYILACVGVG